MRFFYITPVAKTIPFDPDNEPACGFISTDVQSVIEELCDTAALTASPGYSWGDTGNVTPNTWLLNDGVPSNKTGRNFSLYNGLLEAISVSNENSNTFSIELHEHDGTTFTLLATISLVAQRSKTETFIGVNITQGKELAIRQVGGSSKNTVVQIIAKGTRTP